MPLVKRGGPLARLASENAAIDLARAHAAAHTGVPVDQVVVMDVQAAEWPDLRLGCPGPWPKTSFAQVVTPGLIVELDAAGTRLTYHTDSGLRAILCASRGDTA